MNTEPQKNSSFMDMVSDEVLMKMMDDVQDICKQVHAIRARHNIRVRQPLQSFVLVDSDGKYSWLPFCKEMQDCIKDECNVKEIHYEGMHTCIVL